MKCFTVLVHSPAGAAAVCKSNAKARSVHIAVSVPQKVGTAAAGPTDTDPRLGLGERRLWLAAKFHCLRF